MWRTILTLAAFSLAACQGTTGGGCPPLVAYSAETQRQAARELRTLRRDSAIAAMIADYGKTRDACRAAALRSVHLKFIPPSLC